MLKIVQTGLSPYHESEVQKLQSLGHSVTKVEKVRSVYLAIFGENVTHIYYEEKQK